MWAPPIHWSSIHSIKTWQFNPQTDSTQRRKGPEKKNSLGLEGIWIYNIDITNTQKELEFSI